uniref:Core Histone H2A/H2B/H3 domain-containing protein n=1 Tax=Arcella intermedia TaxID=1963864 RepID=A0A6B2LK64_9EUKA
MREIRQYQESTDLLISRRAFKRLVDEITQDFGPQFRVTRAAAYALQEAAEAFLVETLEDTSLFAMHDKREVIMCKDMQKARRVSRRDMTFGNVCSGNREQRKKEAKVRMEKQNAYLNSGEVAPTLGEDLSVPLDGDKEGTIETEPVNPESLVTSDFNFSGFGLDDQMAYWFKK